MSMEKRQRDFTVKEIADILHVSDARVRQLLLSDELTGYKRSERLWLVTYDNLMRYLQEHNIKLQEDENTAT